MAAEIKQTLNYSAAVCMYAYEINLIKSNVSLKTQKKEEKGFNKLQQIIFETRCVY